MSGISWELCLETINILVVITIFTITYKKIDKKVVKRENNKIEVAKFLIVESYKKCLEFIDFLTDDVVNDSIIPKIDFDKIQDEKSIMSNLQKAPFINENAIMDLVKDGQVEKDRLKKYFEIKNEYNTYIVNRITFFEKPKLYESVKNDLIIMIEKELDR